MNPSKKNKLFKKYMSGDISKEEMHELNLYALEDDFLFDALEGSASFEGTNKGAIKELESRLNKKVKSKRRPWILWMSSAAAIFIILVVAIFLLNPLQEQLNPQVAVQEEALKESLPQTSPVAAEALPKSDGEIVLEDAESEAPIKTRSPQKAEQDQVARSNTSQEAEQEVFVSNPQLRAQVIPNKDEIKQEIVVSDLSELEESIQKPTSGKSREVPEKVTNTEGSAGVAFEAISLNKDSLIASKEVASGKEAGENVENFPSIATNNVQEALPSKSKVSNSFVAVPQGTRVKKKNLDIRNSEDAVDYNARSSSSIKVSIDGDEENAAVLRDFIIQNITPVSEQIEFWATFDVNKQGEVFNFVLTKSTNEVLDGQLRSLIESFKGWKRFGNKKVRITFN